MSADLKILTGGATRVFAVAIAAIAVQPILTEPHVFGVLTKCAEAAAVIGVSSGGILAVGLVNHQLRKWASQRPIMPSPSQVYAALSTMPPHLQHEAAAAQAEERCTEPDDLTRKYHNAVVRFCVIGDTRRSMGWAEMKQHVDRPGWDTITADLSDVGVIRIGSGRRPTWYAEGWDTVKLRVAVNRNQIDLPLRDAEHIPVVKW